MIDEKNKEIAEMGNTIADLGYTISKNNNEIAKLQAELKRLKSICVLAAKHRIVCRYNTPAVLIHAPMKRCFNTL